MTQRLAPAYSFSELLELTRERTPARLDRGSFLTVLQTRYEPPKAVEGERRY